MKIVILEKDIDVMGGVERIISTLANSFSDKHDVYVISEHKNKDKPFFSYKDNINIKYILNRQKRNKFEKSTQNFISKVINKLERYQDMYIYKFINEEVLEILRNADCIIFGRVQVALHFLPFFQKNGICCRVIVRDAIHIDALDTKMKYKLKKYFPNNVNTFIVSSDESIKRYKDFFTNCNTINLKKIYNPIGIVPKGQYCYKAKTIVSLGRLDVQKGFKNLILAFKMISEKNTEWKLKIYGKGPEEFKLRKLINKCNLEDKVQILPSTSDVTHILNNSSIFVMTSRYEGYANMLVEAMACSMPVISYDWLMGVNEIIHKDIDGIVVHLNNREDYFKGIDDDRNIRNLAAAMENLINNPEKCELLACNAKKIYDSRRKDEIIQEWNKIINYN